MFTALFYGVWCLFYLVTIHLTLTPFQSQLFLSRIFISLFIAWGVYFIFKKGNLFFKEATSPYQLAIFRIAFYGIVSIGFTAPLYLFNIETLNFPWATIPASQRVALPFMGWYIKMVPLTPLMASITVKIIAISALACTIGLGTRFFSIVFLVATFYLNGFPNFFGKVNHNHYIVWFAAILCFSRCSDVLSIDSYLQRKDRPKNPIPDLRYGLPLKLVVFLIGIIYFFPGFHKIWTSGLSWAFSDNLRNQMYYKWIELDGWKPALRIDYYPWLYEIAALFTLIFETAFIFWVFDKRGRWLAIAAGLIFHVLTYLTLNISFFYLLLCYIAVINWPVPFKIESSSIYNFSSLDLREKLLLATGAFLIAINVAFGAFKINSYPFSCFPTFENIISDYTDVLVFKTDHQELDKTIFEKKYSSYNTRQWELETLKEVNSSNKFNTSIQNLQNRIRDTYPLTARDTLFIYKRHMQLSPGKFEVLGEDSLIKAFVLVQ